MSRPKLSKSTYPSESLKAWSPPLQNALDPCAAKKIKVRFRPHRTYTKHHDQNYKTIIFCCPSSRRGRPYLPCQYDNSNRTIISSIAEGTHQLFDSQWSECVSPIRTVDCDLEQEMQQFKSLNTIM